MPNWDKNNLKNYLKRLGYVRLFYVIYGMREQQIKGFYEDVLRAENLPLVPLVFCRVAKAGACVEFTPSMKPVNVQLDMNRCMDPEYAILHEIAHLHLLFSKGYAGHNASFKKKENELMDKYMYSSISTKHFAK